ncbi:hypothetical protein [Cylindrospermum sp. FACHB-282]|nr:hypothetical protein [Cylindrospermum sp. FACHB-282]MBD2388672.1 hypothetical protein [Cylindrospermum sp. FACHB-282]
MNYSRPLTLTPAAIAPGVVRSPRVLEAFTLAQILIFIKNPLEKLEICT